ncbi:hypothetical protein DDB_G0276145 [Dictyostelium discoideum AX4]|uniref:Uncharacterized protein n=1 Tax=Dictyostelium discoideum TaxID=44689 RepID=Q75JN5_DICDI|nr:hypothetical protein DDB_G0276145 [Dictyostelium discoideum AX4]EAL69372.1 hypothetical protein DDB_G0276145 [Dictyostelium discoideum AX4]|eukprot:XP_643348.1 hypothetical protein DDB_G0276145 [Dictyostelium discoideum AX4]
MKPQTRISRKSQSTPKKTIQVNQKAFIDIEDEKKEKHRLVEAKGRGRRIKLYEKLNLLLKDLEKKVGKEIPSEVLIIKEDLTDDRRKLKSNKKKYNNEDILRKVHVLIHISNCITSKRNSIRVSINGKNIEIPSTTTTTTTSTTTTTTISDNYTISHFPTPLHSPRDIDEPISLPELPSNVNITIIHSPLSSELEQLANLSISRLTQPEPKHQMFIDLYFSSFDV